MSDANEPPEPLWSMERSEVALRRARTLIEAAIEGHEEVGESAEADVLRAMIGDPPSAPEVLALMLELDPIELFNIKVDAALIAQGAAAKGLEDAVEVFQEIEEATQVVAYRQDKGEWPAWMQDRLDDHDGAD